MTADPIAAARARYIAGDYRAALDAAEAGLRDAPGHLDLLILAGAAAHTLGDAAAAEGHYEAALRAHPNSPLAHNNLALLRHARGCNTDAEAMLRRAIELSPTYFEAHNNLGIVLIACRRYVDASQSAHRAIALKPDYADAHNTLAMTLAAQGQGEAAEAAYRRAIELNPNDAKAYNNLANLLIATGRGEAAEAAYRQAWRLRPGHGHAASQAFHSAALRCDWRHRATDIAALARMIDQGEGLPVPFPILNLDEEPFLSAQRQRRCAQGYAQGKFDLLHAPTLVDPGHHPIRERLCIGYLSADFFSHATLHLLRGVLARHDRRSHEIVAYSYGRTRDADFQTARTLCERFVDLETLGDAEAARCIAADGIDILVDLKGYTQHARPGIVALRPAPVIVNWLGYPGTFGDPRMADYLIGDAIVTPLTRAGDFSETLALMPRCYQPNDDRRAIAPRISRDAAGLPAGGFVFCNFNQFYKFNPASFDAYCRLLAAVPDSVLWLLEGAPTTMDNLRREAAARGIDPTRLIFAPPLPHAAHLARLQCADLALDTFPVTSHTTASDALWAGVPLVGRLGDCFVSRVSASLLHGVGLAELIAADWPTFHDLAIDLASDPTRLATLRDKLARARARAPLFDTLGFTRDLERLYARIWEQHARGERAPIVLA